MSTTNTPHRLLLDIPSKLRETDSILDAQPALVIDFALERLQKAGVVLVEWRSLLYRRLNVPIIVKDYSYVVPDEKLDEASEILSTMGLPLSTPSKLLLRTEGDFQARGRFHRITRWTSPASVQHLALYPLSFSTLSWMELEDKPPYHVRPPLRCHSIYVPRHPALYASLIRLMLNYPKYCATRTLLGSDLSQLIGYHLLRLEDGYMDPADDEEWEARQVGEAVRRGVQAMNEWGIDGVWRQGEEWIGDALVAVIEGTGDIEELPWKESSFCRSLDTFGF